MKCPDRKCKGKLKARDTREMTNEVSRVYVCPKCLKVYSSKEKLDQVFNHPDWGDSPSSKNWGQYTVFEDKKKTE